MLYVWIPACAGMTALSILQMEIKCCFSLCMKIAEQFIFYIKHEPHKKTKKHEIFIVILVITSLRGVAVRDSYRVQK